MSFVDCSTSSFGADQRKACRKHPWALGCDSYWAGLDLWSGERLLSLSSANKHQHKHKHTVHTNSRSLLKLNALSLSSGMIIRSCTHVCWTFRVFQNPRGIITSRCLERPWSECLLNIKCLKIIAYAYICPSNLFTNFFPLDLSRTLLALGCHVGMGDEKAEENLRKIKLPKT